jgi:hypothetical protein
LDNEGDISPVEAMEAAIAGPEYQKLVVLDWFPFVFLFYLVQQL